MKYPIEKYLEMLFQTENGEFVLEDDEYIRLVGQHTDRPEPTIQFVKKVREVKAFISKYSQVANLYITLATVKGKGGAAENMKRRRVLFLDFDRKDYPHIKEVSDFTSLIKSVLPQLFIHMIVDTGGGYHFYISIEETENIKELAAINKSLAEIVGADLKATLTTQIARIPTSLNLKDRNNKKPVSMVLNNLVDSPQKFSPFRLAKVEGFIRRVQLNNKNIESVTPIQGQRYEKTTSYFCCEAMLSQGVEEGERNFALGRITKYLQDIKGYTLGNALKVVQEWNRKCRPPKSPIIVEADFRSYWDGDYKLLGCKLSDKADQDILNRYCDKYNCTSIFESREGSIAETGEMLMDYNMLKNEVLRSVKGEHYAILSVMSFIEKPVTKKTLTKALTGKRTKKCFLDHRTLKKYLADLEKRKYIIYDEMSEKYSINRNTYKPTYIKYAYSATLFLINELITGNEYETYLCLVRNLQRNENVTYETLADNLGKEKSHICEYIHSLHRAGLLNIDISYNERGVLYNTYRLLY